MSQAGITRADKAAYLELHGWVKQPRRRGESVYWLDPVEQAAWLTTKAYEIAKARERGGR